MVTNVLDELTASIFRVKYFALKKVAIHSSKTLETTYERVITTHKAETYTKKMGWKFWLMKYSETGKNKIVLSLIQTVWCSTEGMCKSTQ
jgi:hypothetical protein